MDKDKKELEWTAPEFEYYHKGFSWYWMSVILTILIAAFAIWQKNFLFAFFVVLAEIVIIYWARKRPREIKFKITEKGIHIDAKFHSWEEFNGFAIRENEIILRRKARLSTYLKIIAFDEDLEEIKKNLEKILPTFDYEESLMDHIAKILRF